MNSLYYLCQNGMKYTHSPAFVVAFVGPCTLFLISWMSCSHGCLHFYVLHDVSHGQTGAKATIASPFCYLNQRRAFLKPSFSNVLCTGILGQRATIASLFCYYQRQAFLNRRCLTCAARANWCKKQPSPAHFTIYNGGHFWTVVLARDKWKRISRVRNLV